MIGGSVLFVVVDFSEPMLKHVLSIKVCKWQGSFTVDNLPGCVHQF